jgi:hypothetical protein
LDTKRILLNFGQSEADEIPELIQLDLPQSEVYSLRYRNSLMKFRNEPNWFRVDRSSVARDKIETALMCQRAARIDEMLRVTVLPRNQEGVIA